MQPQRKGGLVQSAIHYREHVQGRLRRLWSTAASATRTIFFGELLPRFGRPRPNARNAPARSGCARSSASTRRARPSRARAAKKHKCSGFKKIKTSGLAYHPYNLQRRRRLRSRRPRKDNAPIALPASASRRCSIRPTKAQAPRDAED